MADVASLERRVARARRRIADVIADRADPSTTHLHRRRLQLAEQQLEAARGGSSTHPPAGGNRRDDTDRRGPQRLSRP